MQGLNWCLNFDTSGQIETKEPTEMFVTTETTETTGTIETKGTKMTIVTEGIELTAMTKNRCSILCYVRCSMI